MLRPIKLQSLLYRGFLSSALVPLLVIELCLLLLYFGANQYIFNSYRNSLVDEALASIDEAARLESRTFNQQLEGVSQLADVMQADHQRFFENWLQHGCPQPTPAGFLERHQNGAWQKASNDGGSSVYYASHTKISAITSSKAWCSQQLDPLLKRLVKTNPLVTQAYLNTSDDMNRLYPFMDDAAGQYGPDLHMANHNFYFLADAEHNPDHQPVWTGVYLDPAGQGWMTSVVVPVYADDELQGVSGLDITINQFVEMVLSGEHRWNGGRFLVDGDGVILAMPPRIEALLNLRELKNHVYDSAISDTVEKPGEYNLLNSSSREIRQRMKQLLSTPALQGNLANLLIENKEYLMNVQRMEETGWMLVTLVDQDALLQPVVSLSDVSQRAGFIAIVLVVVFYILFFLYLERKSRHLSDQVAGPIRKLSEWTQRLSISDVSDRLGAVGIAEIDRLYNDINRMSSQLEHKTQMLVDSRLREKVREKEAEMLEELAITDRLSGLYNRRKLDGILQDELARSLRSDIAFSVIMIDIDHFKLINDNFGHATGDHAIIEFSLFLRQALRKVDFVGRWGGEEFMIICPMTGLDGAMSLAQSLRSAVASKSFSEIGSLTASFGVASWRSGEDADVLVQRADAALYEAKRAGRNCVFSSDPDAEKTA